MAYLGGSMLRITLAQINPTIGDIDGNFTLFYQAAQRAMAEGSHIIVFPELSLSGYYPGDLLNETTFLNQIDRAIDRLCEASCNTPGLHWVVGAPFRKQGPGKPLYNSLIVIADGKLQLNYAKQLLPTYDVFDEHRHFEPGPDLAKTLTLRGTRIGFLICEDGWNDAGLEYRINPFERLAECRPDLVLSIHASPSNIGKREQRHALFSAASRRHGLPLVYVNQVGGQDQLVYDGASFAVHPDSGVVFEAKRFEEDICTVIFTEGTFYNADGGPLELISPSGLPTMEFYRSQIKLGLKDYARRCGFAQTVVGSSGGIDSALTLALAAETLGPEHVTAITLPSVFSSVSSVEDSTILCARLGVRLFTHPIRTLLEQYRQDFESAFKTPLQGLALENVQARIRGAVLMEYSNACGPLLLTTGNKSEISVGYCTLYGDTNGGLGLIGDLYKTEVFALSHYLNESAGKEIIPETILKKEPSAELAPGQRDSDSLPPYPVLDTILKYLIEGNRLGLNERERVMADYAIYMSTTEGRALIAKVKNLIARNEYKRRQAPPILRLRARAFGAGWRMPIAARYDYY